MDRVALLKTAVLEDVQSFVFEGSVAASFVLVAVVESLQVLSDELVLRKTGVFGPIELAIAHYHVVDDSDLVCDFATLARHCRLLVSPGVENAHNVYVAVEGVAFNDVELVHLGSDG